MSPYESDGTWNGLLYSRRKLVARAVLHPDARKPGSELWLDSIKTFLGYRRQGYGKILLQSAVDMFHDSYTAINLVIKPFGESPPELSALTQFYEKMGFSKTPDNYLDGRPIWRRDI